MHSPFSCTRRRFVRGLGLTLVSAPVLLNAAAAPIRTAAVIGHTGRGDYGHGLEGIFQSRAGLQTVAVADPEASGRGRVAAKIGAARQYADYREMLEKERPQLVSVAMRHADLHHPVVLAALRAGAHVYCEKPFTTTPLEADELLRVAGAGRLKVAVAHTMRRAPVVLRLRQALREGLLGDLLEMRAHGKQDARAGGEDMMVLGSHLFDLMRCFAGDPQSCSARVLWRGRDLVSRDGRNVSDNVGLVGGDEVVAQFHFDRGVVGTFTSRGAFRETAGPWGMELIGSKGVARINCDLNPAVFVRQGGGWPRTGRAEEWRPLDAELVKATLIHNLAPVDDWLSAIAQDREPDCSGRNGAWAVEMVMAVYQAALGRRRVEFPLASRGHPLQAG